MRLPTLLPLVLLNLLLLAACAPEGDGAKGEAASPAATAEIQAAPPWFSAGTAAEQGAGPVYRSPNDDRQYRHLTLANGLDVLLISDPASDKAAASLSVNVGSFDNPPDREGLAHFLEHMLFLGTDRYPEPDEYQAFISEHGGGHNAYTSLEETNYFFDVDAPHLMAALDRFSRFFVAPLFNPEYVDRERHAVESEYRLKIQDDSRREWDVLRELANPEHPFAKFSVGNLETLADREGRPVREDLLAFYQRHYSANQMNLVVLGTEDLDTLEQAVSERFGEVPNRNLAPVESAAPLFARELPFRVAIAPEKDLRQLSIGFPLPTVAALWPTKPVDYLGHLLGHEGEGTLLAELKRLGLAEALSAGLVYDSRAGALFSVTIALTEEGVRQEAAVTRAFFAWLSLVRNRGFEPWRYGELADLSEIAFRFAEKQSPSNYVRALGTLMHTYPAGEAVRGPFLFEAYDEGVIRQIADRLRPDNAFVTLMAQGVETDTRSAYYQAPYRVEDLDVGDLDAGGVEPVLPGLALALPAPNIYIPEQLTVLRADNPQALPERVSAEGGRVDLWHYPDSQFNTPRALFEARIAIPDLDDRRRETLLDLYRALVVDQLSSRTYPASQAGLGFDLSRWDNGLSLSVQGYSEKQALLVKDIVAVMAAPEWDSARFERVKSQLLRQWRNTTKDWPISQVFSRVGPLLRDTWLPLEKAETLEGLALADVQAFAAELFPRGHVRFYAGGNLDRAQALAMAASVTDKLRLKAPGEGAIPVEYRVHNLAHRDPLPAFDVHVDHSDSVAVLFLQGREDTLAERALFALLQKLTEAPFYSELRTERQLGYVVGSSISPMHRVPGAMFYVQSPSRDSAALRDEIDGFLARHEARMAALTDADLERIRAAVLADIEEKPKNLMELGARHLEALHLGYNAFDFRQRLAEAIRGVSLDQLRDAYRRILLEGREGLWLLSSRDPGRQALDRAPRDAAAEGEFVYPQ
ncbi:MAG: insulinase family protein [Porticoccaceae bacterium]